MKYDIKSFEVVICGGGMAGLCAGLAAARHGAKTCLIHDRPVLGGCASSEIRVTVHGVACHHYYGRETGIIGEILHAERAQNHEPVNENGWTNSLLDMVCYDFVEREPNLTLMLNTAVDDCLFTDGSKASERYPDYPQPDDHKGYIHRQESPGTQPISALLARVGQADTRVEVRGSTFIDCTGDAVVADLAGCEWRWGTESHEEFGEPHAPSEASNKTMGNSIHIRCKDIGREAPFTPPDWAVKHDDPAYFYEQGRKPHDPRGGYWWIEIGVPWNTVYDNEIIRHELTRHALGIWDWMKNHDPVMKERCRTYALDWIGQVPGKRESRRIIGKTFVTENDIQANRVWADEVAYGGWFVDLHTPGGLLAPTSEPAAAEGYQQDSEYAAKSQVGPYGVPLGALLSKDISNLAMAGRDMSCTHAALGSMRVMGSTAVAGQAIGTAAALAQKAHIPITDAVEDPKLLREIQQNLLRDGCFLPNIKAEDPADMAPSASISASSSALMHGQGAHQSRVTGGQLYNPKPGSASTLNHIMGQWIAASGGPVDEISVGLVNTSGTTQSITAVMRHADHFWDYRIDTGKELARAHLTVKPGDEVWAPWSLALTQTPTTGWLRLDIEANPEIQWLHSPDAKPGHVSVKGMSPTKVRSGSPPLAFTITPPQKSWEPQQVVSGVTRPQGSTNCWRSDPGKPLPQNLDLSWETPAELKRVELTFAGHLLREVHAEPPFFVDPQLVRDYQVEAFIENEWHCLVNIAGNVQKRRVHVFDQSMTVQSLRIVVTATNGDPSAVIYEVRCY